MAPTSQQVGPQDATQTPEWWLKRLYKKITDRQQSVTLFDNYYIGDHPLPWLPEQAREEFRRVLRMTRTNYMGLVVDAMVERMIVEGIRVDEQYDKALWRIWQANNLDADSDQAWLEAAKSGQAYLLVGPNDRDPSTPTITVEHPSQAIVEGDPANRRRRRVGLKVYSDEWTGDLFAQLYFPGQVVDFTGKVSSGVTPSWTRRGDVRPNPVGEVPLVELPNNPRLMVGGVSELADLIDIQDRINKTVADRLVTQDFGAFPQKWASGYPEINEVTGEPNKIDIGRNRMVTSDVVETKFGQWDAAPLDPYSLAKKEDVKDIASRSRTPAQYLLSGDFSNVNGETLKASESGLVAKVKQRRRPHGEGVEDASRMSARLAGLNIPDAVTMETIWSNPEFRTEGEMVDALTKMATLGVPQEALWERWGATPQERERWKQMNDEQASREAGFGIKAIRDAENAAPAGD